MNRGTKFWRFSGENAPHAGKSARAPHLLSVFDIFRFGAVCVQPRPCADARRTTHDRDPIGKIAAGAGRRQIPTRAYPDSRPGTPQAQRLRVLPRHAIRKNWSDDYNPIELRPWRCFISTYTTVTCS